jgi:hypothetical protein
MTWLKKKSMVRGRFFLHRFSLRRSFAAKKSHNFRTEEAAFITMIAISDNQNGIAAVLIG